MKLFDSFISLLAPLECLGCLTEGALVCEQCRGQFAVPEPRCYKCHVASPGHATCEVCRGGSPLHTVYAATAYAGVAKDAVWKLKFARCRGAAGELAAIMADRLDVLHRQAAHSGSRGRMHGGAPREIIVTHAPTANARVRQRGYDQAQLIAQSLAVRCGLTYRPLLARHGRQEQIGASRTQRTAQLQHAFRARSDRAIRGRHILLVDDVVTTGATLEAAAAELLAAGARRVDAVVFARA